MWYAEAHGEAMARAMPLREDKETKPWIYNRQTNSSLDSDAFIKRTSKAL
jgi:hypothetical protein